MNRAQLMERARTAGLRENIPECCHLWKRVIELGSDLNESQQEEFLKASWSYIELLTTRWKKASRGSQAERNATGEMRGCIGFAIKHCEDWLKGARRDGHRLLLHRYAADMINHLCGFPENRLLVSGLRSKAIAEYSAGAVICHKMSPVHPDRLQFWLHVAAFQQKSNNGEEGYRILQRELQNARVAQAQLQRLSPVDGQRAMALLNHFQKTLANRLGGGSSLEDLLRLFASS